MPIAPAGLRWREGGLKGIKVLKSIKVLSIKKKEKEKKRQKQGYVVFDMFMCCYMFAEQVCKGRYLIERRV